MGRWVERAQKCPDDIPTKLTEPSFVGFVSTPSNCFQEKTPVEQKVAQILGEDGKPSHHIFTAATASPEWRNARDQYLNHLMVCRACHAPTSRYCPAGTELRAAYNVASGADHA